MENTALNAPQAIATPTAETTHSAPTYIDGPTPRTRVISLLWPFQLDGTEFRSVTIRRINGHEAKAYYAAVMESLQSGAPAVVFPGLDIAQPVWDALDDDDVLIIEQAIEDFLPARFRPLIALLDQMMGSEDGNNSGSGEN
jgi:hypothetical protein